MSKIRNGQSYENYPAIENRCRLAARLFLALAVIITVPSNACFGQKWDKLFNGKNLKGWDTYIGPRYDSTTRKFSGPPEGLNVDQSRVFSVASIDGYTVLKVSGEHFGGISTRTEFSNYHFRVHFKWGNRKYHPKKNDKRDSGVLYHAVGSHGADGGFWMRSQEFQVQEGDCGDYWGVAGGSFEIRAAQAGQLFMYSPTGELTLFNEKSSAGRRCVRQVDKELPLGEWNTLEILCVGDTAVHIMNGTVVMVLQHSSQLEGDVLKPLTKGKIQIQSEGAEVFYRDPVIRPLNKIPVEYLN